MMTPSMYNLVVIGLSYLRAVHAADGLSACPLLGQQYLPLSKLPGQSDFQAAVATITSTLNGKLDQTPYNATTFSIGMFSTEDDGLAYEYHHTPEIVANGSQGTHKADADSVYRIGSISKLLTVYLWLIHAGERRLSDPVTEWIPELRNNNGSWNSVTPSWDDITVGDLAGQVAGLARDYGLADLAQPAPTVVGLPAELVSAVPRIPVDEVPKCGYLEANNSFAACSESDYLHGIVTESPIFAPGYTPVYSNEAFAILGLALSRLTNSSVEALFNESLMEGLGLSGTSYTVPATISEHAVVPDSALAAGWNADLGFFTPVGGYFSSTNDLATLGKAILSSRLIPSAQTNRWLKPTSFVEDFAQGVGRPWEIFRLKVNGQSVDLYGKGGNWGYYNTFFALFPTYGFGLSILTAVDSGETSGAVSTELPDILADSILPALDQIAKAQTASKFSGHFASNHTNSTLTISTAGNDSGLKITKWINNGVDILEVMSGAVGPNVVWRIMPNHLELGPGRFGFTSFYEAASPPPTAGTFYWPCPGWVDVDFVNYGNIPLGQFVFEVDGGGNAVAIEARGVRATFDKVM